MISPAPGGGPAGPGSSPHQALMDSVAQSPQGSPNDLLNFLFSTPEFLTGYQKDVIKAWMSNPAAGEAIKKEGAGPEGGSEASLAQPSGTAQTGQPKAPGTPSAAPATPVAPPGANPSKPK